METRQRRFWTAGDLALLALLLVVAVWVSRDALLDILDRALRDSEQSHILLVPLVAGWLVWLRRSRLQFVRYQPTLLGAAAVALGWMSIWWGYETDTRILQHAGALVMIVGSIVSMAGTAVLRQFMPAFLVLFFALPVPGRIRYLIAQPLQTMATSVTHSFLELFGIAAIRSGNVIEIHGQQVAVGEACNGMRMVFALWLVVFAFAFSSPYKLSTRVLLLILSPLVALVSNVIRLVPTSLVYGYGDPVTAEQFHDYAGWVMLPIALFMLIGVLRMLRWLELPVMSWRLAGQTT